MLNDNYNKKLVSILVHGGVAVIPTDTVYGLVASARDPGAVARLYALKSREHKPGTVIAANIDQLVELGIKRRYLKAVEHLWPNPLSIVIPCPELDYLHVGVNSLAVRVPADNDLRNLLEQTGPLLTSSANLPGQSPANNLAGAKAYFGDKIDIYVDGGDLSGHESSTVIRIDDDAITILRQGACKIDERGNIS